MIPTGHVAATRPPAGFGAVSEAIADLNRAGVLVSEYGTLEMQGRNVEIRIRGGIPCAIVDGVRLEWPQFRTVLAPRRTRP